jgi:hypothetical protein
LPVQEVAAAGLPAESFVALRHGGIIATRGGQDLNTPVLLVPSGAALPGAAAAGQAATS